MEGGLILSSSPLRKSLNMKHKCGVKSEESRKKNGVSLRKLDSERIRASRGGTGVARGTEATARKSKNEMAT